MNKQTARELLDYLERQSASASSDSEAYNLHKGASFILDKLQISSDDLRAMAGVELLADYNVVNAARSVVKEYWHDASVEYQRNVNKETHIFPKLRILQDWLKNNGVEIGSVK